MYPPVERHVLDPYLRFLHIFWSSFGISVFGIVATPSELEVPEPLSQPPELPKTVSTGKTVRVKAKDKWELSKE
jgi:hypothetical protein